ncbi:hypothetical protein [Defluviitalea phaphyphila]|uniref:hypothetical protein n=1 Tax=Defluviitalea phaphyphila TaxID=1473580 RepID=UPI0007319946|nr:hypothetical protein [Defluviitalea phaphyphila]
MFNFLDKFHKKMEWVGVLELIITKVNNSQKYNDKLKNHELINLVFTVLHYIMEKTLSEDKNCTINNISDFLKNILKDYYNKDFDEEEIVNLVKFIVIEILQNNGQPYIFKTKDYTDMDNSIYPIRIKIIEDYIVSDSTNKENGYLLSKQGFEFLFRIADIEEELEISIEQIRLKELLKRKKFSKATEQCQMMLNRIRHKRKDIELFIRRIKENINNVSLEECRLTIESTFKVLNEEYQNYNELYETIKQTEQNILDKLEFDKDNEELLRAKKDIESIKLNIKNVIKEYQTLFRTQQPVLKLYDEAIENSLTYALRERLDIEKDLLEKFEKIKNIDFINNNLYKLFIPLFKPNINKHLNIFKAYNRQTILVDNDIETEDNNILEIDTDEVEDIQAKEIEAINNKYLEYLKILIDILLKNENRELFLSEILEEIKINDPVYYYKLVSEPLFFKTILYLYDIGNINFDNILKENKSFILYQSKDFNINYVVSLLLNEVKYKVVSNIEIKKEDNDKTLKVEYEDIKDENIKIKKEVEISDFKFKVGI